MQTIEHVVVMKEWYNTVINLINSIEFKLHYTHKQKTRIFEEQKRVYNYLNNGF